MARYTLPIQAPAFSPLDRRFRDGMPMQPLTALPQTVDLSQWLGPVRDQNIPALGECSAESGAGAIDWLYRRYRQESAFVGSSLMLYEVERMLGGQLTQDAGARLRQTQVALQSVGTCDTALDPDVRQDFIVTLTPVMIASAARHRIREGFWCPTLPEILNALAHPQIPTVVQLGIVVYPSFESAAVMQTGVVPVPSLTENPLGGHAALAYGYSIPDQFVMARNSWGKNSGQQGNFTLPFAYFNSPRTFLSARAYYL